MEVVNAPPPSMGRVVDPPGQSQLADACAFTPSKEVPVFSPQVSPITKPLDFEFEESFDYQGFQTINALAELTSEIDTWFTEHGFREKKIVESIGRKCLHLRFGQSCGGFTSS